MVVKKNISFSVIPDKVIDRMVKAIDGKGPADLARDLSVSVNNFSNWKNDGVSLRMVLRFSEKHGVSLDWLLFGKQPLEDERGGEWIGLEDMNQDQRNLISVIRQDRILARSLMMFYEAVASRFREVERPDKFLTTWELTHQQLDPTPKRQEPNQAVIETGDNVPPKEKTP